LIYITNIKSEIDDMTWDPNKPFNNLPLIPPESDIESKPILKQCVTARAALAELKQAAQLIPNQDMLINTLPLMEAKDSSEIENIVTTTDKLFRNAQVNVASARNLDPATKEALRYRTALLDGYRAIGKRPLNTNTIEKICSQIKNVDMTVRKVPGTALVNEKTEKIIYTPPEGERELRDLLANWEKYIHDKSDIDPLIRMAVVHYQFEAIHPFTDGNGRTGRIVNSLFLINEKLLNLPILYLSRYIINNKATYYKLLLEVTKKGNWESWIIYILNGIRETSEWTTNKISAVRELEKITIQYIQEKDPKLYSRELVEVIFEQPYCRISNLTDAKIAQRETASKYLKRLEKIDVLKEEKEGRDKLFTHPKLMRLLTTDSNKVIPY